MLSEGEVIGVISLWRREVDPFTAREIDVATTFAAQAAIAIRNANLMQQLELRTRELARSVDELRRSATGRRGRELQPRSPPGAFDDRHARGAAVRYRRRLDLRVR